MGRAGSLFVARKIVGRSIRQLRGAFASPATQSRFDFVDAAELGPDAYTEVYPRRKVSLERPRGFLDADWKAFRVRDIDEVPPDFVLRLSNGYVFGIDGWVGTSPSTLVRDIWQERGFETENFVQANRITRQEPTLLNGITATLAMPWLPNYYHWTVQAVPRVRLIEAAVDIGSVDHWILTPPCPPYVREWLQLLGIDPSRVIEASDDSAFRCETLIAASIPSPNRHVPTWALAFLRSQAPMRETRTGLKCLFVGRRHGETRQILNGSDVNEFARQHGFEPVLLDQRTLIEKIALFQDADCIAGVHGAGMTNMAFCRPGTRILEILPRNLTFPTFWKMGKQLHLEHELLVGIEPRVPFPFYAPDPSADLKVDWRDLGKRLDALAELSSDQAPLENASGPSVQDKQTQVKPASV